MRRLQDAGIEGPLAPYAAGFAGWLVGQDYGMSSVSHHRRLLGWLSRWMAEEGLAADGLSEVVIHRFRAGKTAGWPWEAERGVTTGADLSSRSWGGAGAGAGGVAPTTSAAGL